MKCLENSSIYLLSKYQPNNNQALHQIIMDKMQAMDFIVVAIKAFSMQIQTWDPKTMFHHNLLDLVILVSQIHILAQVDQLVIRI